MITELKKFREDIKIDEEIRLIYYCIFKIA